MKYPEWTPVEWDGNPELAKSGRIHDCWRKSFRHGHVTVSLCDSFPNFTQITYSFGANDSHSMSGGIPGTDVGMGKAYVDRSIALHFGYGGNRQEAENKIYDLLNAYDNATGKTNNGFRVEVFKDGAKVDEVSSLEFLYMKYGAHTAYRDPLHGICWRMVYEHRQRFDPNFMHKNNI